MIRSTRALSVFATGVLAAAVLAGCGTTEDNGGGGGTAGEGEAACDVKLAFFGPETGPAAGLGQPIIQGAQLAIDQYNEDAECDVAFDIMDSQGSPDQAPNLATQAAGDDALIGVVGPAFSGESDAAGPIFAEAGLPTISPSATNPLLSTHGWDTFHRVLGNDETQGPAIAKYINETVGSTKVFVVDDASEYGKGLADIATKDLGDAVIGSDTIQVGDTDFSATITKINSSGADTLFFSGYYAEAALLVSQLGDSRFEGTIVVPDGVKDPGFLEAGEAAEGTIITCPCIPADDPAVAEFAEAYEAEFGGAPGTYAAEAYDAATIFLDGIAAGNATREDMLTFINEYDEPGVTKQLSFDEAGEPAEVHVYAYTVKDGEIVSEGEIT